MGLDPLRSDPEGERFLDVFEQAEELYESEKFAEAEAAFRAGLQVDPESPLAHAHLALCLFQRGEMKLAEAAARRAVAIDGNYANGHYALAFVLFVQHRDKEALLSVERSLELDDEVSLSHSLAARLLLDGGRSQQAWTSAHRALALDPECALAAETCSMVLEVLGQYQEAADRLAKYLAEHPENSNLWERLGWLNLRLGLQESASGCFERAGCGRGILEVRRRKFRAYRWLCVIPGRLALLAAVLTLLLCMRFGWFVPIALFVSWTLTAVRPLCDAVLSHRGQRLSPVELCGALVMTSTGALLVFALGLSAVGWRLAPALGLFAILSGLIVMGALSCEDRACLKAAGLLAAVMVCSLCLGASWIFLPGGLIMALLNVWSAYRVSWRS